jgi:biotin carboxylase
MRLRGGNRDVAATRSPTNGLMLAFAFTLPYHVMRSAATAGLRVHVLGDGAARGLRASLCCRSYHRTRCAGDADALLAEIEALARRYAIDVVFPSDDVSTRLLAALGDRLPVRCVPLPQVATFDLLNDKWRFTRFCLDNGVRAPEGWLFDSAVELRSALGRGEIALPITVKPTNRSGGVGVIHIREPGELALLDAVDYRPILAQRHVVGESVSITAFCDHGRVLAHVAQQRDSRRFRVFADADLLANVRRLIALTGYHGTANFDAVISAADGLSHLVECNPRFWYSIYLVMIAGLNFFELALAPPVAATGPVTLDAGEFRLSLRRILARPWRASWLDWKFIAYCLGDPIPFALQRAQSYDDNEVAAPTGDATPDSRRPSPVSPRLALS